MSERESLSSSGGSVQLDEPDRLASALREIVNVLGPEKSGCDEIAYCGGCRAEMEDALRIARRALGLDAS